jgi:hypothetical protein
MTRREHAPPSPARGFADRSYVGYRWPGLAGAVRLPSGEYAALAADGGASRRLAEAVLGDRLGHAPCPQLLDAFVRDWVRPFARGEFVWPVEAVDEWLGAAMPATPPPAPDTGRLDRALELIRRVLGQPLSHHPLRAPTTTTTPGAL